MYLSISDLKIIRDHAPFVTCHIKLEIFFRNVKEWSIETLKIIKMAHSLTLNPSYLKFQEKYYD